MDARNIYWPAILFVLLIVGGAGAYWAWTEQEDLRALNDKQQRQIKDLKREAEELAETKEAARQAETKLKSLQNDLEQTQKEHATLEQKIKALQTQLEEKNKEFQELQTQHEALKAKPLQVSEAQPATTSQSPETPAQEPNLNDLEAKLTKAKEQAVEAQKQQAHAEEALQEAKTKLSEQEEKLLTALNQLEEHQKQLKEAQAKLEEQAQKLEEAQAEHKRLSQENANLNAKLKAYELQTEQLSASKSEIQRSKEIQEQLIESLQEEISTGQIKIANLKNRMVIRLEEKIIFDSGSAEIKPSAFKVLEKIGQSLQKISDKQIQVEGHTDPIPIGPNLIGKYPTNWELSADRATKVARYLVEKLKIDPARVSGAGYGAFQPIGPNTTTEERRENRRVEFALVPLRSNQALAEPEAQPEETKALNPASTEKTSLPEAKVESPPTSEGKAESAPAQEAEASERKTESAPAQEAEASERKTESAPAQEAEASERKAESAPAQASGELSAPKIETPNAAVPSEKMAPSSSLEVPSVPQKNL